jgi:rhodanese-related sulfurtransferase
VRAILKGATREALVLLVFGIAVGLVVNSVRKDGLSLIAEADAFRVRTNAEFIGTQDAWDLYEQGNAFLVDARDPAAFAREHIEGALNASPTRGGADSLAWMASADPYLIAYADEGSQRQAGVLADILLEAGFRRVWVLLDGIEGWRKAGLPVEGLAE